MKSVREGLSANHLISMGAQACMQAMLTIIEMINGKETMYSGSAASALPPTSVDPTVATHRSIMARTHVGEGREEADGIRPKGKRTRGDLSLANFEALSYFIFIVYTVHMKTNCDVLSLSPFSSIVNKGLSSSI